MQQLPYYPFNVRSGPMRRKLTYDAVVFVEDNHYFAEDVDGHIFCQDSPTACLQEAVNYVAQFGGGRIYVRRGTYYPSNTVYLPDNVYIEIYGDGNETVFKYNNVMFLFVFWPGLSSWMSYFNLPSSYTPSWNAMFRFRDFKVDRSQSGPYATDIMDVVYAKYVEFNNVEVIDNFRTTSGGDCAICLMDNITAIVEKCRIYNKSYGINVGGYLSVAKNNYVVNTYAEGIVAQGFNQGSAAFLPPGYSYGGLSIIEDNTCIDCGRGDEAIAIDYGGSSNAYGVGIIRNNRIVTMNYTTNHMITGVNVAKLIVENNFMEGTTTAAVMAPTWSNGSGALYAVFRNNYVNVTYSGSNDMLVADNHDTFIFENNRINVTYSNISSNPGDFFQIYNQKEFIRNNVINITIPSGYTLYDVFGPVSSGTDSNPTYIVVEHNNIYINGSVTSIFNFYENYSYSVSKPFVAFNSNTVNAASGSTIGILFRIVVNGNVDYSKIYDNLINFTPSLSTIYTCCFASGVVWYVDTDIPASQFNSTSQVLFLKRNAGTATIASGATSVTVNHGLSCTPSKVIVTPLGQPSGNLWVSNITNTSFTINISTAPSANLSVAWVAEC